MSIRLLVADDMLLARAGVTSMVVGTDIEVICHAVDCKEAVHYSLTCDPDVVLLDTSLPDGDSLDALSRIKQDSKVPVLMFSSADNVALLSEAHRLQANGFLSKTISRDRLVEAVRKAATGGSAWTRRQVRQAKSRITELGRILQDDVFLTDREQQVLAKLVEGLANEEAGAALGIQIETVKHHVKHVLQKLGVNDRTQAALWAVRKELESQETIAES